MKKKKRKRMREEKEKRRREEKRREEKRREEKRREEKRREHKEEKLSIIMVTKSGQIQKINSHWPYCGTGSTFLALLWDRVHFSDPIIDT
jgi:uncharacterized membrane protein YdbT with pleckstrin-like domain